MKILHLDTDDIDNPLSGGSSLRNFEIYRRLSYKHDITVLTASYPGCQREIVRDGVKYLRMGTGNERFGLSYHISYLSKLPGAIKKIPHDILVEDFMPPCGGVASFLWTKKPVIASIQWLFAKSWAKKYKLPFHLMERMFLKKYKSFLVSSPCFAEEIRGLNSHARIEIIPLGINERFLGEPIQNGDYILFMGRIDIEQKGLDILIRSFYQAQQKVSCRLMIVGDGFDMNKLKTMISDLKLKNKVELIGKISSYADKVRWYSGAKIVCMPSRFETFGLVALEAFAFGKPVLSFDIPALNDLVTAERGAVVTAFDEKAYTESIVTMLNDPKSLLERSKNCREFACQFTWDNAAKHQNDFYEEILSHG